MNNFAEQISLKFGGFY